ncbi:porin [Polaribacter sp. BAL334]|uniref:porin n=1 Tax=Polaribacter sp. BAL334 TaxID=1708178 RepID=UPI0018D25E60|nr:porin [Polaribacter sp. BAL334]MBG7611520.1 porin [Polaribacter sp. BAL334]
MKILKIIFVVIITLNCSEFFAQNTELSSYRFGEGLNFRNANGSTVQLEGYLQPYFESKSYTEFDATENRYRMRRMRLRLNGKSANERFSYRFQVDLAGADESDDDINNYLLDAYVSYDITNRIEVSFGQRATYTDNRELFMNSSALQLPERSRLTSAFSTIREFGLFLSGNFKAGRGSYLRPYFVLTNGDGANVFRKDRGGLKVGGRIDYLPFGLFTNFGQFRQADVVRENAPKLVVGVNFSHNNGMSSRRGRGSGDIIYLNAANEETLPNYTKYGADFLFKYNGFSVLGEYVKSNATVPDAITQRVRVDGTISSSFDVNGIQDIENYVKDRMILGEAYNIQMGYVFKNGISIDGRYTHLNADEYSFLNNATVYNRPNHYTLGVTKYLSRNYGAKIQASYTIIDGSLGINNNAGNPITGDENLFRLILTLAF